MKRLTAKSLFILMLVLIIASITACGTAATGTKSAGAGATASPTADTTAAPTNKPVQVTWWHSMGGAPGKAIDQLVKDFNASHSDIQVQAVFQGDYDQSLSKMKASLGGDNGPTMIQVYEIGSRYMIDTNAVTPVQNFIDAEHYDTSSWEKNILSYYTFNNKLYSMPFNTSNPILYYNKDMFKAAGITQAPATYEEVAADAAKLTKNGVYGASFAIYGWFMEQFFANAGADYVNNGNGRTAPATESLVNSDAGVKTLTWWKKMVDDKSALNLGRKTSDTQKAFVAGQVAMTLDSTAALRGIVNGVGGKFEVGTAFLPKPADGKPGGVVVGGASNWVMKNRPEAEQKAAWEFMKYLAAPKQQAYWNVNTGYFPVTTKAYDEDLLKQNMQKFPQFQTAVDQLHQTVLNSASQGAVMGVFPEARQLVEQSIEEALNGAKTPKAALDEAATQITAKIKQYNDTVKK